MWIKTALLTLCLAAAVPLAVSAKCEINQITPSQSVGVYETTDEVGFTLAYQADTTTTLNYTASDVWGNQQFTGSVTLEPGRSEQGLQLGRIPTGWYRLRFYEGGREATDQYCAFSVVMPMSVRRTGKNPFAADQAGQYMSWSPEQMAGHARALRLAGVDTVRERTSDTTEVTFDPDISAQTAALAQENIGVLEMLARNSLINYNENLYDVYGKSLANAKQYAGSVTAWECVNEADASAATPDEVASYYKARALGIIDSGSGAVKTFGGLCIWDNCFSEVFMQNDVMTYADNYNLHAHRTGTANPYNRFPSDQVLRGRILSTVYGGGRQVWVTEAGMNSEVDGSGLILEKYMPAQANYVITSAVESIARGGTDKHFWFLTRHYIENGKEFGIFSENDMPYPAYSALAALTYYLGEGKFLGGVRGLPDGVQGYLFSDGGNVTAVLWNTVNETRYVQLNTSSEVEVINLVGSSTPLFCSQINQKVNIPVSASPVMVKFRGRTEQNCYPKQFPTYDAVTVSSLRDAKRIVLKQNWRSKKVSSAKYEVEHGANYVVSLDVYNFGKTKQSGTITANVSELLSLESEQTIRYTISPGSKTTLNFIVKAGDQYETGGDAYLSFTGTAGGEAISPSVAAVTVKADGGSVDMTEFQGYREADSWMANSPGKMELKPVADGMGFAFTFADSVTDCWAYPQYSVPEGSLADAAGLVFTRTCDAGAYPVDGMTARVFAWTSEGDSYLSNLGACTDGKVTYQLNWSDFVKYGSTLAELEPAKIIKLSIGFNAAGAGQTKTYYYKLSGFGWFSGRSGGAPRPAITLSGIQDGSIQAFGTDLNVKAVLPDGLEDVKVYVNFMEYNNCTQENESLNINLSGLPEGACSVIVTGFDRFHYAVRASLSFYVGGQGDEGEAGLFFN